MTPEDIDKCTRDKVTVLTDACDNAAKHYEDYSKGFTALDTKAQAIATISGLVLAAVVAFLKDGRVPVVAQGNYCWVVLILAPPVLALAAVIVSMFGAMVTEVVEPFDAPERMREAKNLAELGCDEFSQEHIVDYYRAQLEHWINAIEDIKRVVAAKAKRVSRGQVLLIAALSTLLLLFVVVLVKSSVPVVWS